MLKTAPLSVVLLLVLPFANPSHADLGGDHLIASAPGRCWRVVHRDFAVKGNLVSGYMFKFVSVGGTGETDDIINFELTLKHDYVDGVGWDETKTQVYTGTGLVKSISSGRVRFEFYVDLGNGEDPITVQGYYHPGGGTSDFDDRVILSLPQQLTQATIAEDCSESLGDGKNF